MSLLTCTHSSRVCTLAGTTCTIYVVLRSARSRPQERIFNTNASRLATGTKAIRRPQARVDISWGTPFAIPAVASLSAAYPVATRLSSTHRRRHCYPLRRLALEAPFGSPLATCAVA